ncbi:MAG: cellulase family glycosylhydrolase [Nitrososphaerales archaeon]
MCQTKHPRRAKHLCRATHPRRCGQHRCGKGARFAKRGAAALGAIALGAATLSATTDSPAPSSTQLSTVQNLKEVNYYPANGGWTYMWTKFEPAAINTDFGRIHALGANTVRIFIQPLVFGYPTINPTAAARLSKVIKLAAQNSLRVHLTLFDLWSQFSDISGSKEWVSSLLSPYRGDPRIAVVELKNEVNPQDAEEMAWVSQMLPYLSTVLPGTLRTVSVANIPPALFQQFTQVLAASPPDFWDYHYYGPPQDALNQLKLLKAIAVSRPLFVGETGYSTVGTEGDPAAGDDTQAAYYQAIFSATAELGLPAPAPWTLDDFAPGAIPPSPTAENQAQYNFGLYTVDGTPKPAAAVVRKWFTSGD